MRQRRFVPKSRRGCLQCKSKRVKCTEEQPTCARCERAGVPCVYEISVKLVNPGERNNGPSNSLPPKETSTALIRMPTEKAPSTVPKAVRSPDAIRINLYGNFLDAWVPQTFQARERSRPLFVTRFGVLHEIAECASEDRLLRSAMDCLSLTATASIYKDQQLTNKAVEHYAVALSRLGQSLRMPDESSIENILAAIIVLQKCEFYDAIGRNSERQGFTKHVHGIQALVEAHRRTFNGGHKSSVLLTQVMLFSTTVSLANRKRNFLDSPRWQKHPQQRSLSNFDASVKLPSLLERADELELQPFPKCEDIDLLLSELEQLADNSKAYLADQISGIHERPFVVESVEMFLPFATLVADRTMTEAYRFVGYAAASLHTTHWIRMLYVEDTKCSLYALRNRVSARSSGERSPYGTTAPEVEAWIYVLHLCRSIPYLVQPSNSAAGDMCCFPVLVFVAKHFRHHGCRKWLEWVRTVRKNAFIKGLSIPYIENDDSISDK